VTIKTKKYQDEDIHFCMTDKAYGPEQKTGFRLNHRMWFKKGDGEWISTGIRSEYKVQNMLDSSFYAAQVWTKIIDPINW